MTRAALVWGSTSWWGAAAALAALALAVLAWGYWRAPASLAVRWVAAAAKTLGVVLLALCLIEPLLTGARPRTGANLFVVMVDNSRSLQVHDAASSASRASQLQDRLDGSQTWLRRLSQDFDVRRWMVDTRARSLDDFQQLSFDGAGSALAGSLSQIARRYRGRPVAGILLMSDGNATDRGAAALPWDELPPVYPVVIGGDGSPRDVSVSRVVVNQTNFEDAPVVVRAELTTAGYRGKKIAVQLLDDQGRKLDEQELTIDDESVSAAARFQVRPTRSGVSFYRVRAAARDELSALDAPHRSTEATLENNSRLFTVDRAAGPYHVLYVCGRPNWEFKFLRRAVEQDAEVRLVGLIRIAKREPKFDFRSRAGESTNPLFRGFGNQADETVEQYDQPVLVRLGTQDAAELRDGFPKSAEDLFGYHALIIDDLEAEHFSPDQMLLIQQFVSHRGGGLLMLGGAESFAQGGYERTPLGDMLPVYLDRTATPPPGAAYRWQLSREGWLEPWVRLRPSEEAEQARLAEMPAFKTLNASGGLKPGATVLARVRAADGSEAPMLAVQPFGKGRTAALLAGDLWRWALHRPPDAPPDLEKAWRQAVRWLVADVPRRVEVRVDRQADDPSETVHLVVEARDEKYAPLEGARVVVEVTAPDGKRLEMHAEPSAQSAGRYRAGYVPRQAGAYRAEVRVTAADGNEVGTAASGWTADPGADEFRTLAPDRAWLEEVARRTGGELVPLAALEDFVGGLSSRQHVITEHTVSPLWHQPLVFLLAIVCLAAEWGVRRWRGLP